MPSFALNTIVYFIKSHELWPGKIAAGPDERGRYTVKTYGARPLTFLVPTNKIWTNYDSAFQHFRSYHNADEWDGDKLIEQMQYLRSINF